MARTYAWDLLWSVAFLPLLSPVTLFLLAVPAFVVNNLAGAYLVSVHHHYMYGIIPGVFMATVEALATIEGLARRWLHPTWLRRAEDTAPRTVPRSLRLRMPHARCPGRPILATHG